jgi:malonate-semialdehyde dehydrogenase (acetylating)/methylmalonate-semialdehyde dehydrogenase
MTSTEHVTHNVLGQPSRVSVVGNYVDGCQSAAATGVESPITDPATGQVTKHVRLADETVVDQVVASAAAATESWSLTPPHVRARVLFRFRDLVERHADRIAGLITAEHGKTLEDARGETQRGLEVVEFACGIPQLLKGEHSEQVGRGIDSYSLHQPLGVVAGVTPFNFPAMVPMWMFPIAIACGNTFVLKPSEKDPSASLVLAELLTEAGAPAGALNVVQGGAQATNALLNHPDIAAISFVGSTAVAEYVYRTASAAGKRVQALGGAKNHAVVMPDADLDQAATALLGAAFGSAGERCMAISVAVVVGDSTADALVRRLAPLVENLRVGPGAQEGVEMGPLISGQHRDKVRSYLEIGVREGAELVVDGRQRQFSGGGFFLGGSLFDHVRPNMTIYREEIFGPVLAVVRVDSLEQAIELVNGHEYGNGAAIFTRDGNAGRAFTSRVAAGMVGINIPLPVPMAFHSFGGWKRSLFGDLSIYGPDGVRFYTRRKTAVSRWPDTPGTHAEFSFPTHA